MNVNPVSAPGPASTAQVATRTESRQPPTTTAARVDVRQRPAAAPAETANGAAAAVADQSGQAASADRQKAEQLKAFIGDSNMRLSTYHDKDSGRSVLEVRDQTTGNVVSQYPSEELIRLYAALRQPLVDQSA